VPERCVPENKWGEKKTGSRKKEVKVLVGGNILGIGRGLGDEEDAWT